jgi:hypothetical protein
MSNLWLLISIIIAIVGMIAINDKILRIPEMYRNAIVYIAFGALIVILIMNPGKNTGSWERFFVNPRNSYNGQVPTVYSKDIFYGDNVMKPGYIAGVNETIGDTAI